MIIRNLTIGSLILACSLSANSQENKKAKDAKAIKSMCGCYEVQFNFAETFQYPKDTANYVPSKTKHEKALEWIEVAEENDSKIVMQHILITGKGENDIVKHWRQDWIYENTNLYDFYKDNTWKFKKLNAKDVKGQWTQKVYQVDDSPRYEGTATWSYLDGKTSWTNVTDAPLPRREHTKRDDYNVLKRRNIHEITSTGWNHEQDNDKLIRDNNGKDYLLAQEKGFDVYTKVDDSKCAVGQNWWSKNKQLWSKVRAKWNSEFAKNKDLVLNKSVDRRPLFMYLFELKPDATQEEVNTIIDKFIVK
jgi:hypothetical protein